ncbi:hypothetical protein [Haloimpatiens lingqiaonensis]|uniref:hypothetical protein n=1 Tax=Haloimpatiens lingqiaonensis TaxID=1380675 RepID=UPI0037C1AB61
MKKVLYVDFNASKEKKAENLWNNYGELKKLRDITITIYFRALKNGEDKVEENYLYIKNLSILLTEYFGNNTEFILDLKKHRSKINKILRYKVKSVNEARQYLIYAVDFFDSIDMSYSGVKTKKKINKDTIKSILWLIAFFAIYSVSEFVSEEIKSFLTTLDLFILVVGIIYITYKSTYYDSKILSDESLSKNMENMKNKYCC